MLNKTLIAKLPTEFQYLYKQTSTKKIDYALRRLVTDKVRDTRAAYRQQGTDLLAIKALRYPTVGLWSRLKLEELARQIYENKSPDRTDLGEWVSVELELVFRNDGCEKDFVAWCRQKGLTGRITIKDDGSLRGEGTPREVVVTFKKSEYHLLQSVCYQLNLLGCKVNRSCGTHVHFDVRHLSPRVAMGIAKRVARVVPVLKLVLPKSRAENPYCEAAINKTKGSRYSFVNVQSIRKYGTIEIRGHSGTIDPDKILYWIDLMQTVMTTKVAKAVKFQGIHDLFAHFNLSSRLSEYLVSRYTKFNPADQPNISSGDDIADDQIAA